MSLVFEENELEFQELFSPSFTRRKVRLSVARLDKLHPVVSGNKLFKLHYFLEAANGSRIVTFGGAYSNHLVATAWAARELGLPSIGIVRGEKPPVESFTLQSCREYGMQLEFISRDAYKNIYNASYLEQIRSDYGECIIIPEGGYHPLGAKGASLIMARLQKEAPTHVCVSVGTATTLAGLISSANPNQQIIGFPVLKNMADMEARISWLLGHPDNKYRIIEDYHFGGYAKTTNELISFMNGFYEDHNIPLDLVYTAKMMFGTTEKTEQGFFPEGSNIICLHTGGLQGNCSLPTGTLIY